MKKITLKKFNELFEEYLINNGLMDEEDEYTPITKKDLKNLNIYYTETDRGYPVEFNIKELKNGYKFSLGIKRYSEDL